MLIKSIICFLPLGSHCFLLHITFSITIYLSFHNLDKELVKLILSETKRYLYRAILEYLEFITQYYLFSYSHNLRHISHPWYTLLVLSLQILNELFDGKRVSLNVHVLLILCFPPNHSRGKHGGKMFQCLVIVDALCDEFLSKFPSRVKVLQNKGFKGWRLENVGYQEISGESICLGRFHFTRKHQVKLRRIGYQEVSDIF